MEFKVGDKVKNSDGEKGEIIEIDSWKTKEGKDCFAYLVKFDDEEHWMSKDSLRHCLLTADERVILRNLDKKYKWIARDENGELYIYIGEPFKDYDLWRNGVDSCYFLLFNHLFQFIKWEDKEPYNIEELLKG